MLEKKPEEGGEGEHKTFNLKKKKGHKNGLINYKEIGFRGKFL